MKELRRLGKNRVICIDPRSEEAKRWKTTLGFPDALKSMGRGRIHVLAPQNEEIIYNVASCNCPDTG